MNAPEFRQPALEPPARHCIGNRFVASGGAATLPMIDPSDGSAIASIARGVRSDRVFVNNGGAAGRVEFPCGGVKTSEDGREKGFEALHGFTTLKTVALRHG